MRRGWKGGTTAFDPRPRTALAVCTTSSRAPPGNQHKRMSSQLATVERRAASKTSWSLGTPWSRTDAYFIAAIGTMAFLFAQWTRPCGGLVEAFRPESFSARR
jgi:hypothetical protein